MKSLFRILAVALISAVSFVGSAIATPVLYNISELIAADGTSNTILFSVSGDSVNVVCADGSVRTVGAEALNPCPGGAGNPISGNTTVACGDGSVRSISGVNPLGCDGSVRGFFGDGSVRVISVDVGSGAAVCFSGAHVPGNRILDGTSNTIRFGEASGLNIIPGSVSARAPVQTISDGTSNTIAFGELPGSAFCLGDTTIGEAVLPGISDGTSNTILLGEDATIDFCFAHARLGRIADGNSNTIVFGETQGGICLPNLMIDPGLAPVATVAEPISLALIVPALLGLLSAGRLQSARGRST